MTEHICLQCRCTTPHRHMHDTAHGIPETHMAGSERFECEACGHSVSATSPEAGSFPFILDKVACDD